MTDQQALLLSVAYALVIVVIVNVNIWYYKERARMTPEERKAEDEEIRSNNPW
jgi:hypothetical protein